MEIDLLNHISLNFTGNNPARTVLKLEFNNATQRMFDSIREEIPDMRNGGPALEKLPVLLILKDVYLESGVLDPRGIMTLYLSARDIDTTEKFVGAKKLNKDLKSLEKKYDSELSDKDAELATLRKEKQELLNRLEKIDEEKRSMEAAAKSSAKEATTESASTKAKDKGKSTSK